MIEDELNEPLESYVRTEVVLDSNTEFRINHGFKPHVYVRLLEGSAQILGAEMTLSYYELPLTLKSLYIYSLRGCKLEVFHLASVQSVKFYKQKDEDNFASTLISLNAIFESHRKHAFERLHTGPRIVVTGGENSGKSSIIRVLANYAVRNEWKPTFVDLDPFANEISTPGTISATVVSNFMPFSFNEFKKLCYFYGYNTIKDRFDLYVRYVKSLIGDVNGKMEDNVEQFKAFLRRGAFLDEKKLDLFTKEIEELADSRLIQANRKDSQDNGAINQSREGTGLHGNGISVPKPLSQDQNLFKALQFGQAMHFEDVNAIPSMPKETPTEVPVQKPTDTPRPPLDPNEVITLAKDYFEKDVFASGIFVNLPNEISNLKNEQIKQLMEIIDPDYIIVVYNDSLKSVLEEIYENSSVAIIRLIKNTGVTALDSNERKLQPNLKIQNFFYSEWLMCVRDVLPINDITIYQIESSDTLPLIYISSVTEKNLRLTKIDPRIFDLKGKVLGLINHKNTSDLQIESIVEAELISLIMVADIDNKSIALIRPKSLPENYSQYVFCIGNIKL